MSACSQLQSVLSEPGAIIGTAPETVNPCVCISKKAWVAPSSSSENSESAHPVDQLTRVMGREVVAFGQELHRLRSETSY